MLVPDDEVEESDVDADTRPQFRGYLVDLLAAVAKRASFIYSLRAVDDGHRGSRRPDGTWSGLVGELIAGVSTAHYYGSSPFVCFVCFVFLYRSISPAGSRLPVVSYDWLACDT